MNEQEPKYIIKEEDAKLLKVVRYGIGLGTKQGIEQAVKSWLSNTKDITPNTERESLISEIVKTFEINEALAEKIVNNFFNEKFKCEKAVQPTKEQEQLYAKIEWSDSELAQEQYYREVRALFKEAKMQSRKEGREEGREEGIEEGLEQAVQYWLNNTIGIQLSSLINEVVETFKIDDDLAEKIVDDFFEERRAASIAQEMIDPDAWLKTRESGRIGSDSVFTELAEEISKL